MTDYIFLIVIKSYDGHDDLFDSMDITVGYVNTSFFS